MLCVRGCLRCNAFRSHLESKWPILLWHRALTFDRCHEATTPPSRHARRSPEWVPSSSPCPTGWAPRQQTQILQPQPQHLPDLDDRRLLAIHDAFWRFIRPMRPPSNQKHLPDSTIFPFLAKYSQYWEYR